MATRKIRKAHAVDQTEKMLPFITCTIAFSQHVCELVFELDEFDLDYQVQIDPVKRPIERNSLGSSHVAHRRTSAFNNYLDFCVIVFKNTKQGTEARQFCVK